MALQLRSGPAIEPISLTEAKNFMRIDETDGDVLINSLITAARIYIETTMGLIMTTESWSYYIDKWPNNSVIYLPLSPIQSVDEIRIHTSSASYEILPVEDYETDTHSNHPRIKILNRMIGSAMGHSMNQIEMQFTSGFGDTMNEVPADLKQAMLLLVSHWFEQREPIGYGGTFAKVPTSIEALLASYKKYRVQ